MTVVPCGFPFSLSFCMSTIFHTERRLQREGTKTRKSHDIEQLMIRRVNAWSFPGDISFPFHHSLLTNAERMLCLVVDWLFASIFMLSQIEKTGNLWEREKEFHSFLHHLATPEMEVEWGVISFLAVKLHAHFGRRNSNSLRETFQLRRNRDIFMG